jgi:hypothetical protein
MMVLLVMVTTGEWYLLQGPSLGMDYRRAKVSRNGEQDAGGEKSTPT